MARIRARRSMALPAYARYGASYARQRRARTRSALPRGARLCCLYVVVLCRLKRPVPPRPVCRNIICSFKPRRARARHRMSADMIFACLREIVAMLPAKRHPVIHPGSTTPTPPAKVDVTHHAAFGRRAVAREMRWSGRRVQLCERRGVTVAQVSAERAEARRVGGALWRSAKISPLPALERRV